MIVVSIIQYRNFSIQTRTPPFGAVARVLKTGRVAFSAFGKTPAAATTNAKTLIDKALGEER